MYFDDNELAATALDDMLAVIRFSCLILVSINPVVATSMANNKKFTQGLSRNPLIDCNFIEKLEQIALTTRVPQCSTKNNSVRRLQP